MEGSTNIPVSRTVLIRPAGHLPKWPGECVVCGQPCKEMRDIRSHITYKTGWGGAIDLPTGATFQVPMHQACRHRFRFSTPLWVHAVGLLFTGLMGYVGYLFMIPGAGVPVPLIVLGVLTGATFYLVTKGFLYPNYVKVVDKAPYYEFSFRDPGYTQKFAALNADGMKTADDSLRRGGGGFS